MTFITRLLGRPQPQMYPPIALNQYKWVNRTHKHFFIYIYASRPHENFEIDFTPKLSKLSSQHVQYGSNLIICYYGNFFLIWGGGGGGPGEPYVESGGTKV